MAESGVLYLFEGLVGNCGPLGQQTFELSLIKRALSQCQLHIEQSCEAYMRTISRSAVISSAVLSRLFRCSMNLLILAGLLIARDLYLHWRRGRGRLALLDLQIYCVEVRPRSLEIGDKP